MFIFIKKVNGWLYNLSILLFNRKVKFEHVITNCKSVQVWKNIFVYGL